jgi:hypothetical protein
VKPGRIYSAHFGMVLGAGQISILCRGFWTPGARHSRPDEADPVFALLVAGCAKLSGKREEPMSDAKHVKASRGVLKNIMATAFCAGLLGMVSSGAGVCQTPGYGDKPDQWAP